MEPQKVPERLTTSINYKVLLLILGFVVCVQVYILFATEENADLLTTVVSVTNPLAASAAGFYVAKKYLNSEVFGKSYLVLAIGFCRHTLFQPAPLGVSPQPHLIHLILTAE